MIRVPSYRTIWWTVVSLFIVAFAVASVARFQELREPCDTEDQREECAAFVLSPEQQSALDDLGVSLDLYAMYQIGIDLLPPLAYLAVGILMLRRPVVTREHTGLALGIVAIGLIIIPETISALERGSPGMQALFVITWTIAMPAFIYVITTFPNGRFEPRWLLIPFAIVSVGWGFQRLSQEVINSRSIWALDTFKVILITAGWPACLFILGGQISRYRNRYSETERQQIKWVLFGISALVTGAIAWTILFGGLGSRSDSSQLWLYLLASPAIVILSLVFPATVGMAIFRHHLYDIDIILNRAVVYTVLTLGLGATYVLLVVGGGSLLRALTGESTQLVVAISTLLIAALFRPLRNLLQSFADRRFYRRRYNTRQTLEEFGAATREAIDLTQLTGELTTRISATMQPEHISVWMRREPERNNRD